MTQEQLFNKINVLGDKFKSLSGIVQNDLIEFPITKTQLVEFILGSDKILNEMVDTTEAVLSLIKGTLTDGGIS